MSSGAPGRHPRFSRERIGEVALAIADRDGFEAVSMRRVAQELGAGTMTLYHYLRTKDDLVALMDELLMGRVLVSEKELARPWREALTAILRRSLEVRVLHPWSLIALQDARLGRNALRHAEQTLRALEGSPFTDEQKLTVMTVADAFVDGQAIRTAAMRMRPEPGLEELHQYDRLLEELERGPYPLLQRSQHLRRREWERGAAWMDEVFEQGLRALLDGLTSSLAGQS